MSLTLQLGEGLVRLSIAFRTGRLQGHPEGPQVDGCAGKTRRLPLCRRPWPQASTVSPAEDRVSCVQVPVPIPLPRLPESPGSAPRWVLSQGPALGSPPGDCGQSLLLASCPASGSLSNAGRLCCRFQGWAQRPQGGNRLWAPKASPSSKSESLETRGEGHAPPSPANTCGQRSRWNGGGSIRSSP